MLSIFSCGYAAAAKSLQSCPTLCDPIDGSPPGIPRPWDSPGKNTGVGCHFHLQWMKVKSESKVAQLCPNLHDPKPTRLLHPWDLPGKRTGVGCYRLLQAMKVKSESEVTQSRPTPSDPMDCSPPGSSIHGISQARVLVVGLSFNVKQILIPTILFIEFS